MIDKNMKNRRRIKKLGKKYGLWNKTLVRKPIQKP